MDESSKREAIEMIRESRRFDRVVENFIANNKNYILEFYSRQVDKQGVKLKL